MSEDYDVPSSWLNFHVLRMPQSELHRKIRTICWGFGRWSHSSFLHQVAFGLEDRSTKSESKTAKSQRPQERHIEILDSKDQWSTC